MYFDTSALVKLYYPERESQRVANLVQDRYEALIFLPLHELELNNALALKVFRKEITREQQTRILKLVQHDISNRVLSVVQLNWNEVFEQAISISARLTPRLGNRSLDTLHIATALHLKIKEFLTFDQRQAQAARVMGLKILSI